MTSGMDWFEAYDAALAPVLSANGFLAVVAGAEESGLLARLVIRTTSRRSPGRPGCPSRP